MTTQDMDEVNTDEFLTQATTENPGRAAATPSTVPYLRGAAAIPSSTRSRLRAASQQAEAVNTADATTPWNLWTAAHEDKKEFVASQATLTTVMEESRR